MVLWRISRHRDLSGTGGLRAPGRWHHQGHPIVYLAESPAAALLEVCVHTSATDIPPDFTLLRVESGDVEVSRLHPGDLPEGWQRKPDASRDVGTAWLRANAGVLVAGAKCACAGNIKLHFQFPTSQCREVSDHRNVSICVRLPPEDVELQGPAGYRGRVP